MSMSAPSFDNALRTRYAGESDRIREAFASSGDGRACVTARSALVDWVVQQLYSSIFGEESGKFSLIAMGGFGRGALFPHSDVDLLFLCGGEEAEQQCKDRIRMLCQELWDLPMRVSPATRTLAECDRLYRDNVEFTIALLDTRYLAGNREFFEALHYKLVPQLITRELQPVVQRLAEVTSARHAKFGNTIFHLEPNLKESPGGLRDFNVAAWLSLMAATAKHRRWPGEPSWPVPAAMVRECESALDFLFAARCFLHYRAGRDDNQLTWEAQDEAAQSGIGAGQSTGGRVNGPPEISTGEWMRRYFRHARVISRLAAQLMEEVPTARSSLYHHYQQWRSRVSNADFSVLNGRIFLQQPSAIGDPELMLRTFEFMALHGLKLSTDTERRIAQALPADRSRLPHGAALWEHLRQILIAPAAADALRAMQTTGLLPLLLPEFEAVDALVIRDYYHRYTVDEHTFLTIESLHGLQEPQQREAGPQQRFAELLAEVERPELLYLALLLHDVGKGFPGDHVPASLHAAQTAFERLELSTAERETVTFLIAAHLDMSATLMRRDIFDAQTVRAFAAKIEHPERLKMLALLTWADIKSVNPEALTPWKAETLWQLYIAASNSLERSVDDARYHRERHSEQVERIHEVVGARHPAEMGAVSLPEVFGDQVGCVNPSTIDAALDSFLDGLPRRYFLSHAAEEIAVHFTMALRLWRDPVQVELHREAHVFHLTLVTIDRPALFSTIAGVLFAWGLNIVKAGAFSNSAGTVVDSFYATDLFRTLELNPPERERFKRSLIEVLCNESSLERLLERRRSRPAAVRVSVPTRLTFDNDCSAHSTLLEVVAQDRPGLLHRVSTTLAETGCNIELALVDTEGQVAIDVFYLTANRAKLSAEDQERVRAALLEELSD